jgi:hypothetical protein
VTASALGLSAGIEHGYLELLQGNTQPDSLFIASIGHPEWVWNRCEPALTIIPNFYVTGILAIILGLITIIWSAFFIRRKRGGPDFDPAVGRAASLRWRLISTAHWHHSRFGWHADQ